MINLRADFRERVDEVEAYLDLVTTIEAAAQSGAPIVSSQSGNPTKVLPLQQKILYAGVYLHLYSLVESTVCRCIAAIEEAATHRRPQPGDLSAELKSEWVRSMARTHEELTTHNRLEAAMKMCDHLIDLLPTEIKIDTRGGGNWDDESIFKLGRRLGMQLQLRTASRVKRPFRDGRGYMQSIRYLRNKLAHGEISFSQCGDELSAEQLKDLKDRTVEYMTEVVECFDKYIKESEYLHPSKRSA